MAEFKHLVFVKFKEGVDVEETIKGMEELVWGIELIRSFERGHDTEGQEMLTQGFTYFPNGIWVEGRLQRVLLRPEAPRVLAQVLRSHPEGDRA